MIEIDLPCFPGHVVGGILRGAMIGNVARDLEIYSVHIPGSGPRIYEANVIALVEALPRDRTRARILAGDFNITVGRRQPGESLCNRKAEVEILEWLDKEFALVSVWLHVHPGEPLAQSLRWSGNQEAAHHCDAVFVDRQLLPSFKSAEAHAPQEWRILTDHNALVVDFE